jgi:ATP-dependent helicase/nuclease subunit A
VAAAQAAAEEVLGRESLVAAMVGSALASDVVRDAATRPHWREVYVGAPVGGTILEGYIDLLVRADDGLVIVDYKTDSVRDALDLSAKVARYRPQLAAYAAAVEAAVGEPVVRAVLLFLSPSGSRPVEVPDLAAAVSEVRRELAGPESTVAHRAEAAPQLVSEQLRLFEGSEVTSPVELVPVAQVGKPPLHPPA